MAELPDQKDCPAGLRLSGRFLDASLVEKNDASSVEFFQI